MDPVLLGVGAATAVGGAATAAGLVARRKGLHRWLLPHLLGERRGPRPGEPVTALIAVCDHYEPKRDNASPEKARARVKRWVDDYPRLFGGFRDSSGRPPRHTFFYPADEYEPEHADAIAGLCRQGFGEMEVHLHHDNDTADNLRRTLLEFKRALADRHGMLSVDKQTGETVYGFIHGNWCLDNSRPDGRWCGVNNELDVLRETGCYGDFTMPSAPSDTQTRTVNRIYWAVDDPWRPKSHDVGTEVGTGEPPTNALLMIQGPLGLDWSNRKWALIPRIENANLQKSQPPSEKRFENWLKAGVKIPCRPDWYFVKLHTHGVQEPNQDVLLGEPMVQLHRALAARAERDPGFRYHYVTAREMANLALAAAAGATAVTDSAMNWRFIPTGTLPA
jgi:hypothetical protein